MNSFEKTVSPRYTNTSSNQTTTNLPKLYLITNRNLSKQGEVSDVKEALESGIKIIQYREKESSEDHILKKAKELKKLTKKHNALLIINDHPKIAEQIGADGIHIGQEDMPIKEAVKIFSGKIIGVSVSTIEEAKQADEDGATYLGIGPIFDTGTKKDAGKGIGLEKIRQIKKQTTLPIVAIGGINKTNTEEVLKTGADSVAVISAIIGKNIKKETLSLLKIINQYTLGQKKNNKI